MSHHIRACICDLKDSRGGLFGYLRRATICRFSSTSWDSSSLVRSMFMTSQYVSGPPVPSSDAQAAHQCCDSDTWAAAPARSAGRPTDREHMATSQPAVTHALAELKRMFGAPPFIRSACE